MKIYLALFLALPFLVFSKEKYGVYDSQGSRISTFEAERHELLEKTRQIKSNYLGKAVYISSMQKGKSSKPSSRYRFKTGSYIEATRNETFSLCPPDKKAEGTWISEYSVSLNLENCVSIQTPDFAGSTEVLFLGNSGRTDTIQVLVDQSYVQMGDYSHKLYVFDPDKIKRNAIYFVTPGHYEGRVYSQPLIVDKTMFTVKDAWHYYEIDSSGIGSFVTPFQLELEYKNVKFEGSVLPLVSVSTGNHPAWKYANLRSKKEGLDTAYIKVYPHSKEARKLISLGYLNGNCDSCAMLALDTSASGYRKPFDDEWFFLMRAGASTRYYWGDEDMFRKKKDSLVISRYEWVRPDGLKPVAKLLPNAFGLYDMAGIAVEVCDGSPEGFLLCGEGRPGIFGLVERSTFCSGFRLLRKTPKLHKLEKFL
jgi:hypothetical protein